MDCCYPNQPLVPYWSAFSNATVSSQPSPPEPRRPSDFSINAILRLPTIPNSIPSPVPAYPPTTSLAPTPLYHLKPLAEYNAPAERAWSEDSDSSGGFPRKQRTVYHQYQIRKLEEAFRIQQYMVGTDRVALSQQLGLTETQVRVWFQNRRSKWRKEMREAMHHNQRPSLPDSS